MHTDEQKQSRLLLRNLLATLYDDEASARRVATDASLDKTRIAFSGHALNTWHAILVEAERCESVTALLDTVLAEYADNADLADLVGAVKRFLAATQPVAIDPVTVNPTEAQSAQPTQTQPDQSKKRVIKTPRGQSASAAFQTSHRSSTGLHAVHITLLQLYPFLEPVFAPEKLAAVGRWEHLLRRKDLEPEPPCALFQHAPDLRKWIRTGRPIIVPNLGIMKPLRRPHLKPDRFYAPFYEENEWIAESGTPDGPLPFYPLQILPSPQNCRIRLDPQNSGALAALLGQPLRTFSVVPMIIFYPTGCLSVQLRLYLEGVEPLPPASLTQLLKGWHDLPWSIRNKQEGAGLYRRGIPQLLDELALRFRRELLADAGATTTVQPLPCADWFVLFNVQGSLHDDAAGTRHKQAQLALSQLAGVDYQDAAAATVFGERHQEEVPWLLLGKRRAALAVDDAVQQRLAQRGATQILEARRALRNRAISAIEFSLVTRLLYAHYGARLQAEQRKAELADLQLLRQRLMTWGENPALTARIYGSLLFEIATIRDNLPAADPRNPTLWAALYDAVLRKDQQNGVAAAELAQAVQHAATALREEIRQRRSTRFEQVTALTDLLLQFKDLIPTGSAP